jgi:hypothetical protein
MCESQESSAISSESSFESAQEIPTNQSSYWLAHIESCENSGLNQAEYCRRHDLKYCVFHYWKRKLRKPSPVSLKSESKRVNFVEVSTSLPFDSGRSFRTAPVDFFRLWVGGICVEVGNKFDPESLSQLLGCLRTP